MPQGLGVRVSPPAQEKTACAVFYLTGDSKAGGFKEGRVMVFTSGSPPFRTLLLFDTVEQICEFREKLGPYTFVCEAHSIPTGLWKKMAADISPDDIKDFRKVAELVA